jgi:hypothetical protein
MKQYYFYSRFDSTKEAIGKTRAFSRLAAAKEFARTKRFTLKQFLKLFGVAILFVYVCRKLHI